MHPLDPFRYLLGNAASIRRISYDWCAPIIGFLFVLTAGIARNYDHLNLLEDKEWFLGPIIMSIFSTIWIGLTVFFALGLWKKGNILRNWLGFLTLFWMTAPAAWLYALPFEQFMTIGQATVANFVCLVLVSSWRVALIIRGLTILCGVPWQRSFLVVVAPAAIEMWIGLWFKQLSLVSIMGGIRVLDPHEEFIKNATISMMWVCFIGFFIAIAIGMQKRGASQTSHTLVASLESNSKRTFLIWLPPLIALGFFAAISVGPQKLVRNGEQFESLYYKDAWPELYTFLEQRPRSDFSPSYKIPTPYRIDELIEIFSEHRFHVPTWIADHWEAQLVAHMKDGRGRHRFDYEVFTESPLFQEMAGKYPDVFTIGQRETLK